MNHFIMRQQTINQPISHSVSQLINQISQSFSHSVSHLFIQSVSQSVSQSVHQSIHPSIHPSINQSINQCFQTMRKIRKELGEESTHEGASMVVINIITHGGRGGVLCSADQGHGLHIPDLIGTLTDVEALRGKPKIFFFNACRGGEDINLKLFYFNHSAYIRESL